jgi:Na+-transporting NADH:ubiquinone oxidoreductase subunit B
VSESLRERRAGAPAEQASPVDVARPYRPAAFTGAAPHVRDRNNLGRIMRGLMLSLLPVVVFGLYNTGLQVVRAATDGQPSGWQPAFLAAVRLQPDAASSAPVLFVLGLTYFVPVYATAGVTAALWQWVFATARKRVPAEGLGLVVLLFALCLPPTIAYWKVAVGMSFGVVVGREIFGGTGKNFLHPALVGYAFLYFAYPDALRGQAVWVPVDGWTGGTPLTTAAVGADGALAALRISWSDAFVGYRPGSFGETSTLACVLGGVFLLARDLVSWRIIAGGVLGLAVTAWIFESLAAGVLPLADLPWYWHATLGSFAFGLVFFATDAVTAPVTGIGKWTYGILIGAFTVLVRVANPVHSEGVMLAILFGNTAAPLIDYFVVTANRRKRERRLD